MPSCVNCGNAYQAPVYRTSLCESCGKELKTCKNCRHYSPGAANDCREPVGERVLDKDKANFCDWFIPAENAGAGSFENQHQNDAKDAFNRLFGDD